MKRGESRFFLNWQMPKEISKPLHNATSDYERSQICQSWLNHTSICEDLELPEPSEAHLSILQQFTDLNCEFAKKNNFTE